MASAKMQQQRFELKYLIDESLTSGIRDFVSCYLELDDYAVGRPNFSYPVHSVYLDSPDLRTHHATINGTKNRYKLRLRYYDDKPNTPVFFEVKARVDNCILKQRCGVKREAVPLLLTGQLPDPDQLFSKEPKHLAAIQRFSALVLQIRATPKIHNNYLREAWVSSNDNSVRVTFDRQVFIEPHFQADAVVQMKNPVQVFPEYTILELKFTTRYPNWFNDMVRHFNLMQWSSAKYSEGIVALGEHCFYDSDKPLDYETAVLYALRSQAEPTDAFASNED